MTALRGGESYAFSFGVSVERLRLIVLLRVSVLTAVAVAFTGVIGFIGLVGPHIARMAFGPPSDAMTPDVLRATYRIEGRIETCSQGKPFVVTDGVAAADD